MEGLRLVLISDTHGHQNSMDLVPDGDVLIHCGDFTRSSTIAEIQKFKRWFSSQNHTHKLFIAGNHECSLETDKYVSHTSRAYHSKSYDDPNYNPMSYSQTSEFNCVINTDESNSTSEYNTSNIRVYGSPWQPEYRGGAFGLPRGQPLCDKWSMIPSDTDILVTHTPPHGILDRSKDGIHCGCSDLRHEVRERIKPRIHVFGHIHEARGTVSDGTTLFINAATCNVFYKPVGKPIVVFLPFDKNIAPTVLDK